ncbi:uncharacterized protein LOC110459651 [Mizuhopecten yessoensis]|uniref:Uncharacterized protein n=1 Tax=Mizuhopecten yessoensis TaxID=6573 RepID=A0A210Q491_MIZYE|nr:uncharacterized protein LOC110459651 [Mizuhopecten yessoensis]OWF43499.1 hypothetical protein KP79_PYT04153 [Mizuhopecten yessoensis]
MTEAIFVHGLTVHRYKTEENDQRFSRRANRITIGNQMQRWLTLKAIVGLWKNEEVAKMLMDSWSSTNGIYLEDGSFTELPEKDASPVPKEEEESIEDDYEDLPILERQLEDWEVLSRMKTTVPDITDSKSSPPASAALQPNLKSSAFHHGLIQTAQRTQSHQHSQIQILPQVKNLQQVQNSHEIQKSQLAQIPEKQQFLSLQTQNAAPGQPGVNMHWMFFPKTGGKPLLVLPNTGIGPKSVVTGGCIVPSTVTGSASKVLPLTKDNSQVTMISPKVSSSRTSPGKCLPVLSTNSVLQPSNFEQVAHSDCNITQLKFEGIKSEPESEEELDNKVNKTNQVSPDTSYHTSGLEADDIVLNLYCSSGDDADDDDDNDEDDDEIHRPQILKPSLSTSDKNKTTKKHKASKPVDAANKDINPSPKKVNVESSDTVKCFRSERLRKRGRISFVELLKGNVVFEKGKNGKIYAKERVTAIKTTSSVKVQRSKERNPIVGASTEASTGKKMHNQKNKSNSYDSEVTKDDGSSSNTDSEEVRYSDSDSDFDPDGISTNVELKTRRLKRKSQSVSDNSVEEHYLTTKKKKVKTLDRVVCFGGS